MIPKINSATKLYALIGDPVDHSLSPLMQNAAFQSLDLNCIYLAFRVEPSGLRQAVEGMKSLGVLGFNVTIPHKVPILRYLDEVDPHAADIGAVNTVTDRDGNLVGYNTDGAAALAVLNEEVANPSGRKVILLGAGGAAKSISYYIAPLAKNLVIINRTKSTAADLARTLCTHFRTNSIVGEELTREVLRKELIDADILINATSLGMYPNIDEAPIDKNVFHPDMVVFDIVYNPPKTRLLREAEEAGARVINGIKMLVYQGALAFEIWTGRRPPIDVMLKTLIEAIQRN